MAVTLRWFVVLYATWSVLAHAGSARMSLELPSGLTAESDYWPGEADRPAILILHGFLQTREFPTVRRLAEGLADEGYSVLLPSLTLGLDRRRQSVACEAIHTHSMQQDVGELRAWIDWLWQRHDKPPVIVGHSAGGAQIVALLDTHPDLVVEQALLISLSYFGEEQGPDRSALLRARAQRDLAGNPDGMSRYALTFCQQYVTAPAQLLSYLDWDKHSLREALGRSPVPVTVVYGGSDTRVDSQWLEELRDGGVRVRRVRGANHFFDLAHEFELFDEVLDILDGGSRG